jgi:valyl-tRNA synthetase
MNKCIKDETKYMEKFDLNMAGTTLYNFIWHDYCDNYIEMAKFNQNNTTKSVLLLVLTNILKMMHPFTPFITDEIYNMLPIKDANNIMISTYPEYDKKEVFVAEEKDVDECIEFITLFRNKKADLNTKNYDIVPKTNNELINNLLRINDKITNKSNYKGSIIISSTNYKYVIYYDNEMTLEEKENLIKEIDRLKSSIARRESLLSNQNYVNKAPKNIVDKEKEDLEKEKKQLKVLETNK